MATHTPHDGETPPGLDRVPLAASAGPAASGAAGQARHGPMGGFQAYTQTKKLDADGRKPTVMMDPAEFYLGTAILVVGGTVCYVLHRWLSKKLRARHVAKTRRASTIAIRRGVSTSKDDSN